VTVNVAPHTASAGQWYFPCVTPEPSDVDASGNLDLVRNLRRELQEETGPDINDFKVEPTWVLVHDRGYLNCVLSGLFKRTNAY